MIKYYSVNGNITPKESAVLGVTDLAILRGYGLFDFFMVKQGRPVFYDDYFDRIERSAKILRLDFPLSRTAFKAHIHELITANEITHAGLKMILTGGYTEDGFNPTSPNLLIIVVPLPQHPAYKYQEGVKLMLHEYQRSFPAVKSINYLMGVHLHPQQLAVGAEDILYHQKGVIRETVRANFFIVDAEGRVITPGSQILEGVTRKQVLRLSSPIYKTEIRDITVSDLAYAKEAFLTSSTKQIMPVVRVDDIIIGSSKPGPITRRLSRLLKEEEQAYLSAVPLRQ